MFITQSISMGPGDLTVSVRSAHTAVLKQAFLTQPCLQLWAPCHFSANGFLNNHDHRAQATPTLYLLEQPALAFGSGPKSSTRGYSLPPAAHQQSPPSCKAPCWLSHADTAAQAPCLPVGLRFISQTVFYAPRASQGSGFTIMCKLLPVSETRNSHPARNPTITQLTKLVMKQPQHLQAGLAESPCPPGERALAPWSAALHHPAPPGWLSPALWGKQGWEGLCGGANWTLLQALRSGPRHLVSRNQFDVCSCLSEGRNTVPVNLHRMATWTFVCFQVTTSVLLSSRESLNVCRLKHKNMTDKPKPFFSYVCDLKASLAVSGNTTPTFTENQKEMF